MFTSEIALLEAFRLAATLCHDSLVPGPVFVQSQAVQQWIEQAGQGGGDVRVH